MSQRRAKSPGFGCLLLLALLLLVGWIAQACGRVAEAAGAHPVLAVAIVGVMAAVLFKFVLPAWMKSAAQEQRKRAVADWWLSQNGRSLEQEAVRLYSRLGYRVEHKGGAGDQGVDLLLGGGQGLRMVVQCKAYAKPIGPGPVRDLYGTLLHQGAQLGILVAPRGFSEAAKRWASGKPIQLLDAWALADLSGKGERE